MKTRCTAHSAAGPFAHSAAGPFAHSAAGPPAHRSAGPPPPAPDSFCATPDDIIAALVDSQSRLPNPEFPTLNPLEHHGRLLDIYAPLVGRLLRAARDQDRRGPSPAQQLDSAIDRVLDELSQSGELEL